MLAASTLKKSKPISIQKTCRGPYYKVLLHNRNGNLSDRQERKYVVGCILKTFEDMESKEAIRKVIDAYRSGSSILRIYPQDKAEDSCEILRRNAISSSIEPAYLS